MAEEITIARPYAEAVYRLAQQNGAFAEWSRMLQFAASVATDAQVQAMIGNPKFTHQQLEQLFLSVCEGQLNQEGKNLIGLLLENGRLAILPHIVDAFEKLKAEQEGVQEATITSAFPVADAQQSELVQALETRFGRKIKANVVVDPQLIGGVKVELGDEVFDASVRGRLQAMAFTLKR
jgi:F-type H+-transporting ATPase subunit delta